MTDVKIDNPDCPRCGIEPFVGEIRFTFEGDDDGNTLYCASCFVLESQIRQSGPGLINPPVFGSLTVMTGPVGGDGEPLPLHSDEKRTLDLARRAVGQIYQDALPLGRILKICRLVNHIQRMTREVKGSSEVSADRGKP